MTAKIAHVHSVFCQHRPVCESCIEAVQDSGGRGDTTAATATVAEVRSWIR